MIFTSTFSEEGTVGASIQFGYLVDLSVAIPWN